MKRYGKFETNLCVSYFSKKRIQSDYSEKSIAKRKPTVSTKAQLAMQEMHEQAKKMKQSDRKLRRELEKERKFTLKQEKRHRKAGTLKEKFKLSIRKIQLYLS